MIAHDLRNPVNVLLEAYKLTLTGLEQSKIKLDRMQR
jgi:hypothetical protein